MTQEKEIFLTIFLMLVTMSMKQLLKSNIVEPTTNPQCTSAPTIIS
jgi:hypothetical protein